jgi:AraC-like DNA-binding protein
MNRAAIPRAFPSPFRRVPAHCRPDRTASDLPSMDPLSDVLRAVRLSGAFFYSVEATHPWSVSARASAELAPRILPHAEHLIPYHVVMSGSCWGGLHGEQQVLLEPGDAILFPQGDAHLMCSLAGHRVGDDVLGASLTWQNTVVRLGGRGGTRVTLMCGFLGCDARPYNPLLSALPRMLHAKRVIGPGDWLAAFPGLVVSQPEGEQAGRAAMVTRMAELMFVEVVRRHLATLPPQESGWLAGLRDPVVTQALAQLHATPGEPWTLDRLARAVATSRTRLAERFTRVVGVPPMQYLAKWRLQLAAERLARDAGKVAAIGEWVGYGSEAAFSRAFKRETGVSPAEWRRRHTAP